MAENGFIFIADQIQGPKFMEVTDQVLSPVAATDDGDAGG